MSASHLLRIGAASNSDNSDNLCSVNNSNGNASLAMEAVVALPGRSSFNSDNLSISTLPSFSHLPPVPNKPGRDTDQNQNQYSGSGRRNSRTALKPSQGCSSGRSLSSYQQQQQQQSNGPAPPTLEWLRSERPTIRSEDLMPPLRSTTTPLVVESSPMLRTRASSKLSTPYQAGPSLASSSSSTSSFLNNNVSEFQFSTTTLPRFSTATTTSSTFRFGAFTTLSSCSSVATDVQPVESCLYSTTSMFRGSGESSASTRRRMSVNNNVDTSSSLQLATDHTDDNVSCENHSTDNDNCMFFGMPTISDKFNNDTILMTPPETTYYNHYDNIHSSSTMGSYDLVNSPGVNSELFQGTLSNNEGRSIVDCRGNRQSAGPTTTVVDYYRSDTISMHDATNSGSVLVSKHLERSACSEGEEYVDDDDHIYDYAVMNSMDESWLIDNEDIADIVSTSEFIPVPAIYLDELYLISDVRTSYSRLLEVLSDPRSLNFSFLSVDSPLAHRVLEAEQSPESATDMWPWPVWSWNVAPSWSSVKTMSTDIENVRKHFSYLLHSDKRSMERLIAQAFRNFTDHLLSQKSTHAPYPSVGIVNLIVSTELALHHIFFWLAALPEELLHRLPHSGVLALSEFLTHMPLHLRVVLVEWLEAHCDAERMSALINVAYGTLRNNITSYIRYKKLQNMRPELRVVPSVLHIVKLLDVLYAANLSRFAHSDGNLDPIVSLDMFYLPEDILADLDVKADYTFYYDHAFGDQRDAFADSLIARAMGNGGVSDECLTSCSITSFMLASYLYYNHDESTTVCTLVDPADTTPFSLSKYPFLLNPDTKFVILKTHSNFSMEKEIASSFFESLFSTTGTEGLSPYIHIQVRREFLLQDALRSLAECGPSMGHPGEYQKMLRVTFIGEEGIDEGGLQKEFFELLIKQIFDRDFGMFIYDAADTYTWWFNGDAYEDSEAFWLVGVVLGLAIYNNIIIDVHFPDVIYKKLLGLNVTLVDLIASHPSLGRGLKQLLDYDGDDVEDIFGLTWVFTKEVFGEIIEVPLCSGGNDLAVTKANKHQFVNRYVDYVLKESVERVFTAFKKGFYDVMVDAPLNFFRSDELCKVINGIDELDMIALEASTTYRGGFNINSPTVRYFWSVVHSLPKEDHQRLLAFVTGSSRVPIGGMSKLEFTIQCHGSCFQQLLTAHTCFNTLLMPKYNSLEVTANQLRKSLDHGIGFGLK